MSSAFEEMIRETDNKYNWNADNKYNYEDTFLDKEDIESINKALIEAGFAIKNFNKKMSIIEKERGRVKARYNNKRRELLANDTTSVSETQKKLIADIECEDLEYELAKLNIAMEELKRLSFSVRTEIDILQTLGHNLRREMTL